MTLPTAFIAQMRELLGPDLPAFLEALSRPAPVSVRRNFQKLKKWRENFEGVKWNNDGVYLDQRPVFTLDPLFHAGAYYVQEASSMLISAALRGIRLETESPTVLDLCAAPGGKSTLLASELPEGRFLVCNEVIGSRYQVLIYNLVKWGQAGVHASQADSRHFAPLAGFFDLVLADAPCSGEGLFRKDPRAIAEWSPAHTDFCAGRQRRILGEAAQLVRPGGFLLYSTCTYNTKENQENARWTAENLDMDFIPLEIPPDWGVIQTEWGAQCFPHRVRGEGFFLACFQKKGGKALQDPAKGWKNWLPVPKAVQSALNEWIEPDSSMVYFQTGQGEIRIIRESELAKAQLLDNKLQRFLPGQAVGIFKGKDFIPAPELALNTGINWKFPRASLSREEALIYLKKGALPGNFPQGWFAVEYEGLPLGWAKGLNNRVNNYYPKEWRIIMDIPEN